jgi:hypothetical protein
MSVEPRAPIRDEGRARRERLIASPVPATPWTETHDCDHIPGASGSLPPIPGIRHSWLGISAGHVQDRGNKVEPEPVGSGRQRGYKFRGNLSLERLIAGKRDDNTSDGHGPCGTDQGEQGVVSIARRTAVGSTRRRYRMTRAPDGRSASAQFRSPSMQRIRLGKRALR